MSNGIMPLIIGLCGRSGSGKSFVSRLFENEGVPSVDTDAVYRQMTSAPKSSELSECMKELVSEFGVGILCADLSLNRRALADIVFAEDGKSRLAKLNEVTHKHILSEADRIIAGYAEDGKGAVIVDAPLLFESGYHKKCDFVIAARAPEEVLISRIMIRDGLDRTSAERRLASQISDAELEKMVDFVIDTDSSECELSHRVREILLEIGYYPKG